MLRLWCDVLVHRATSASRFHVALHGGALDFDEVQTIRTLMPWLWAMQTCKFSKAGEAEPLATTVDAQQYCMTEDLSRIYPTSPWLSPRDRTENLINVISPGNAVWHVAPEPFI